MADNNVGTLLTAPVTTFSSSDTFPTAYSSEIMGGYKTVDTLVERDAITPERREIGMLVYVRETETIYQLYNGILNTDFKIVGIGFATEPTLLLVKDGIGDRSDAQATDDVGSFSLISLLKRLLSKIPALISNRLPVTTDGLTDNQLRSSDINVHVTNSYQGITDTQIRATPLDVSVVDSNGLTDNELRATPLNVIVQNQVDNPVTGLTDTQLRASAVPVSISSFTGLTDTQLRATALPVSLSSFSGLTDTQLRASALPVSISGTPAVTISSFSGLTDTQLRASAVPVSISGTPSVSISGTPSVSISSFAGLTDTQLRATAVPVSISGTPAVSISGTPSVSISSFTGLTDTQLRAAAVPVSISGTPAVTISSFGGLTDTQLRATAVPVSISGTPTVKASFISNGSDGTTLSSFISDGTATTKVAKASAGNLFSLLAINTGASVCYLKLYNKTSVTIASDTPIHTIPIPSNSSGAGFSHRFDGVNFSTGISYVITQNIASNDTTAVSANTVSVCLSFT